ncbi:MAG: czcB 1 [Chthoniobacteraceae bacterium]|nr:czcB 1 [Chthoniobacteraceae bacterium]MDB6171488.1 czcB 1 [Chthoniobacteraceae bacterium]
MKPFLLLALAATLGTASAEEAQGIALPFKQVSVSSPVFQEIINSILVEEGDTVTEGQPIVQLRSEREELEVLRTQKLIELTQFKAKGADALFKDKMGSKEKALEEQAQLELSKILHQVAEVALKEKTIRSPLSGIVVKKYKEAGESVEKVEKLIDIVNIDRVYVQFYLDPTFMETFKKGQPVKVKFPVIANEEFTAEVSFIDPRIDAGSGLFRIKVEIPNADHKIKAGMRGKADFGKPAAR